MSSKKARISQNRLSLNHLDTAPSHQLQERRMCTRIDESAGESKHQTTNVLALIQFHKNSRFTFEKSRSVLNRSTRTLQK